MVYIIIKEKISSSNLHTMSKDQLHERRKKMEDEMRDGLLTKDQMDMVDCKDKADEERRVNQYVNWKDKKVNGVTNEERMRDWSECNREFKRRGEEGRPHSVDDIRESKKIKYD